MPKLNIGEMWPQRGATLGFTWPCLIKMNPTHQTFPLHIPFIFPDGIPKSIVNFFGAAVTADATQTGTVHCDPSEPTWFTHLWVYFLVFEHFALTILLLVWGAVQLQRVPWPKPDKSSKKGSMAGPYSPALLSAALPVLSVACFGEVAQHIFDNWLYLGLVPSYYLAVFYSGLVLGTGMIAVGIWDCTIFSPKGKPGTIVWFALPASALVVFALIAGAYYHCNGQAQAADASAKNPKLNGASTAFEKCMTDPTLLLVVWVVTFGALAIWTIAIFFVSNAKNQFKCGTSFFTAMLCLALGVISSIIVTVTGYQQFHVTTAGGFFGLFLTELIFITKVVPASYTSSSQASV